METIYTTRDAAAAYVIEAIENGDALADEYRVDEIVDACFTYRNPEGRAHDAGFVLTADDTEFWEAVAAAQITEFPCTAVDGAEDETDEDGPTGRAIITFIVGVDSDEWDDIEIDRLQFVTDDPEEPEDLDELSLQFAEQGWRLVATPNNGNGEYRVARA